MVRYFFIAVCLLAFSENGYGMRARIQNNLMSSGKGMLRLRALSNKVGETSKNAMINGSKTGEENDKMEKDSTGKKETPKMVYDGIKKKMADFQNLFRHLSNKLSSPSIKHAFTDEEGIVAQFLRAYGEHINFAENEQNAYSLTLKSSGDWSSESKSGELSEFIEQMFGQNVSEIHGKKGAKYSDEFFNKITTAILKSTPDKVPPMLFEVEEPKDWPKIFTLSGSPLPIGIPTSIKIPGNQPEFECLIEHYDVENPNWLGLASYDQYTFHKESMPGSFTFRLYHENSSSKLKGMNKGNGGQKLIGFELEVDDDGGSGGGMAQPYQPRSYKFDPVEYLQSEYRLV